MFLPPAAQRKADNPLPKRVHKQNGLRQLSLRSILIVPFVAQIFLAVGLTGWLSLRNGQRAVDDLANQLQDEIVALIEQHIQSYLQIPQNINEINAQSIRLGLLDLGDRDTLQRHFWNQLQVFGEAVDFIYIGYPEGGFDMATLDDEGVSTIQLSQTVASGKSDIYTVDDEGNKQAVIDSYDYDARIRPWYMGAVENQEAFWADAYLSRQPIPDLMITASLPVYDQTNQFLGVVANDIYLDGISDFLQGLQIGQTGKLFILEETGLLVGTSTADPIYISGEGEQETQRLSVTKSPASWMVLAAEHLQTKFGALASLDRRHTFKADLEGESHFFLATPIKNDQGLDWVVVAVIPEADFTATIQANTRMTIVLCLIALALATGSGILTARWIANSLQQVSAAAHTLAQGHLEKQVGNQNIQELDVLAQSFNRMAEQLEDSFVALETANVELEERVEARTAELRLEKEKSESLLLNILPEPIAQKLKLKPDSIAESFDEITILFADIVGFTPLSARLEPIELVKLLNTIFSTFDELAETLGLEKIKTIGDSYMVAAGLPIPQDNHAEVIAEMALAMQYSITRVQGELGENFQIRIGINTGMAVAGVIGTKKFIYDLWGDAVNVASRMESSGEPGKIQVTAETYSRLQDSYIFEERGLIAVKGKGNMPTYWLIGKRESYKDIQIA